MIPRVSRFITFSTLIASVTACSDDGDTSPADAGSETSVSPSRDTSDAARSESRDSLETSSSTSAASGSTSSATALDAGTSTSGRGTAETNPTASSTTDWDSTTAASSPDSGSETGQLLPDLTISAASLSPRAFTSVEVPATSCEIQAGCYSGDGTRTLIPFELTITNSGQGPLVIGKPWENAAFHVSACGTQYRVSNFVKAEVLGTAGEVMAVAHLPTSCIANENSSTFTCSIQGLGVNESSEQPANTCRGLDVTGLTPGAYSVRLTINPDHQFEESDFANNSVTLDLDKPECEDRFCGGVCCPSTARCEADQCLLPDLRANKDAVERSLIIAKQTFGTNACELEEMCITGPGKRRLLQFEGRIENVGLGDLNPGPEEDNPLFEYSACHDHYHFLDFTDYKLLTPQGEVAVQGHKQSFCLVGMEPVEDYVSPVWGEVVHPEPGPTGCSYLEAGWADIYSVGTPCQWVDVTDLPSGDYVLQVSVNPSGKIAEGNVENNVVQVPVYIPPDGPCQDEEVCGDVADQDCDSMPDSLDPDCWESAFCCGEEDVCHLGHNWRCDCNGEPEWEHHDCESAPSVDGGYLGGECCSADDTCNWANDGVCDCNGDFEWDVRDCEREVDFEYEFCCAMSGDVGDDFCYLSYNGQCDCETYDNGWDYYDCHIAPELDYDGGSPQDDACCTPANTCDYEEDGYCDCEGRFSWDEVDCAMSSGETY